MKVKYEDHPKLDPETKIPSNGNTKIWRYMDFTKFVSLLQRKALFFCRSDRLGDSFEGSFSKANVENRNKETYVDLSEVYRAMTRFTIVNCWNISDYESASLWSLYAKAKQGIAIQSTVDRLKQCFGSEEEPFPQRSSIRGVFIGRVKYIDYKIGKIPEGYFLAPFLHKRKSFEHENELRAIIMKFPGNKEDYIDLNEWSTAPDVFWDGEYVNIDVQTLIEKVYVLPMSPDWFRLLVNDIMKKYGLRKKALKSNLDESPVY
jgi:hypothetical protein